MKQAIVHCSESSSKIVFLLCTHLMTLAFISKSGVYAIMARQNFIFEVSTTLNRKSVSARNVLWRFLLQFRINSRPSPPIEENDTFFSSVYGWGITCVQMATNFALAKFHITEISEPRLRFSWWNLYMAGGSHFMVPFEKFGPCFMIQTLRYFATMKPWYFLFFPRTWWKPILSILYLGNIIICYTNF